MISYISMIPYANMAPVRALGCPDGFEFIYLTPRQSVEALLDGLAVATALPVGALLEVGDKVEAIGAYGIAASRSVGSVFLHSAKRLEDLGCDDTVRLTGESATSVLLAYMMLRGKAGRDRMPQVAAGTADAAAEVVIGDEALVREKSGRYPYCYDLSSLWHEVHGKPMVFARWVVRKDAPAEIRAKLLAWLGRLDAEDAALVEKSAPVEAKRLGLPVAGMIDYLRGMRRVLDGGDLEGQELFLRCAREVFSDYMKWRGDGAAVVPGPAARIDRAGALELLQEVPLGELMGRAHEERMRRHRGGLVSFVMDTNPNYTNICTTKCSFCAFHRNKGDAGAYTLSPAALAERVKIAADKGATTVLFQGGVNPEITLEKMLAYIGEIRKACPGIHIHPFSPAEIDAVARQDGQTLEYVLKAIRDAGVHTLPGGGAEILSDRVRREVSPDKCSAERWLEVMESAHRLGFRSTATMMYGHIETGEDIVEHFFRLRELQDRTGGFSSFIAWSFKPGHSKLGAVVKSAAHPALYVRITAVARLVLDNFEHIQSSWFSETENAGGLGLLAGADDFGGILVEENVLKTTGHERRTTAERVRNLIRKNGFIPARRDSDYRILEVFDK